MLDLVSHTVNTSRLRHRGSYLFTPGVVSHHVTTSDRLWDWPRTPEMLTWTLRSAVEVAAHIGETDTVICQVYVRVVPGTPPDGGSF